MTVLKASDLAALEKGKHHDGGGLYFVKKVRGASWVYRYTLDGRAREMGLGAYPEITLKAARDLATKCRSQRARGVDPISDREEIRRRGQSFEEAAREYWQVHCQHYAKPQNWIRGMEINVFPHIGRKPVAKITPGELAKFLRPIWSQEKTRKLIQWIRAVFHFVSVDDPRVDRDVMERVRNILGPQNVEYTNLAAIPWKDIPDLWAALPNTVVGLSMKMIILTGQRVNPVIQADWDEFDFKDRVWTIPAGRVKKWKHTFRVPLTRASIETLREAHRKFGGEGLVFPSPSSKSGTLSNNAHRLWLHKHNWKDETGALATAHGLRSALRTWMDDQRPPIEWRLAEHIVQHMGSLGSQTEQAYLRSDHLEARRDVMERWEDFVLSAARRQAQKEREKYRLKEELASITDDGRTLHETLASMRGEKADWEESDTVSDVDIAKWGRRG